MNKIRKAFVKTIPVMAGYLVLGLGFGIVLQNHGYGVFYALIMSVLIYAGSMQFMAINLITAGAGMITVALTTLMVNARHLFYGISMVDKYKDTNDFPVILAISEAILHEVGHAKDNDDTSSVQEELQCLALNVLAHKFHKQQYPDIFENKKEKIISDGVELYTNLYFDSDPHKTALIKRVQEKYGFLDAGDEMHQPSNLAILVKSASIANFSK